MDFKAHAVRVGAAKLGISVDAYRAKLDAGLKRCWACKTWHPVEAFPRRWTAPDGRDNRCAEANRTAARKGMRRLKARRRATAVTLAAEDA